MAPIWTDSKLTVTHLTSDRPAVGTHYRRTSPVVDQLDSQSSDAAVRNESSVIVTLLVCHIRNPRWHDRDDSRCEATAFLTR